MASELHAEFGFTRDPHDDFPNQRPAFLNAPNHTTLVTLKVGKLLQQQHVRVEPAKLTLWTRDLHTGQDTLLSEVQVQKRNPHRCAAQFITPLITIPDVSAGRGSGARLQGDYELSKNPFVLRVEGTEDDLPFQRFQTYQPEKLSECGVQSPPPPSAACQNGKSQDEFGYCKCEGEFSGDDCSVPRCAHGGIADLTVCNCPSGFFGRFCENVVA